MAKELEFCNKCLGEICRASSEYAHKYGEYPTHITMSMQLFQVLASEMQCHAYGLYTLRDMVVTQVNDSALWFYVGKQVIFDLD